MLLPQLLLFLRMQLLRLLCVRLRMLLICCCVCCCCC